MKNIQLRPSQFVLTYGVGSLIEGSEGSGIIRDFSISEVFRDGFDEHMFSKYVISIPGASRLTQRLASKHEEKERIGIFRIPTNDEEFIGNDKAIYKINRFPSWALCHNDHIILKQSERRYFVIYKRYNTINNLRGVCPVCVEMGVTDLKNWQGDNEVMRFVRICPSGHLNDVDWDYEIHFETNCTSDYFLYIDRGSEFRFVNVKCPECGDDITMQNVKQRYSKCSGRHPHKEKRPYYNEQCILPTQLTLRNSSSVFIPEIITAITLPKEGNIFYRILNLQPIYEKIITEYDISGRALTFQEVFDNFIRLNNSTRMIRRYPEIPKFFANLQTINSNLEQIVLAKEIIEYFTYDIIGYSNPLSEYDLRLTEYEVFHNQKGSLNIDPSLVFGNEILIDYTSLKGNRITFKVLQVLRLETVIVQKGFYRYANVTDFREQYLRRNIGATESDLTYRLCKTQLQEDNVEWYCGLKLKGEGIYIEIAEGELALKENNSINKWEELNKKLSNEEDEVNDNTTKLKTVVNGWASKFKENRRNVSMISNPLGVWWHTLSHLLIKALCLDCGYSSAAIRERLYIKDNKNGGLLLYTSTPGEDGTLGGLVSQVDRFGTIFKKALDEIDYCSNDPLCEENKFGEGKMNGAACYACCFISETSCEFGNIALDRNVLKSTL